MELRHLRYFQAVAQEGSFTRAAARLRAATWAGRLSTTLATELVEAHEVIAHARLRHHVRLARSGQPPDNHVRADELGTLERRHLRDAFGVVQQAQAGLGRSSVLPYL